MEPDRKFSLPDCHLIFIFRKNIQGMNRNVLYIVAGFMTISGCLISKERNRNGNEGSSQKKGSIWIDRVELNYSIEGQGQPCLVIGSSVYYPRTFSKELQEHLKMIFVDMRWFAEDHQADDFQGYDIQSIADDIENVRSELDLERVLIMGHSIHGTIAFEYARRYAEHVTGLVLIGSPNIYGNETYDRATRYIWETASSERKEKQKRNWEALAARPPLSGGDITIENYIAMAPKYWYDPDYDARWLWEGMTINQALIEHLYGIIFEDYHMFKYEKSVPAPTLVVMGKYDYAVPSALWQDFDSIPDLTLKLFEKSGHTPQLEEPGLFLAIILEWLEKNNFSN